MVKTMVDQFPRLGIQLLTGTGGKKLLTKDGRITGVLAEDKGGEILIHCHAVVVSAGGFAWNDELLAKYAFKSYKLYMQKYLNAGIEKAVADKLANENIANDTRREREKSNMYIKDNGNLTTEKTNINVRKHNFYGK